MIQLRGLSKQYPRSTGFAVHEVDLDVSQGEFLALVGASGCGKTTTLKIINRLIEPTSGSVFVEGNDISGVDPVDLRRSIGYIFQGIGLFPHYRVEENVAAIPNLCGWEKTRMSRRVDELLDLVGLPPETYRTRYPHQLSGGQQQRVGVARALAVSPKVMLMDEPFGALDPITRDNLQSEFSRLHRQLGLTVVMVTHDMTEALLMADRIAVMSHGKILQLGTPHHLMAHPENKTVASLIEMPKKQADRLEEIAGEEEEKK